MAAPGREPHHSHRAFPTSPAPTRRLLSGVHSARRAWGPRPLYTSDPNLASVAASLEVDQRLLPYLPYLLQDLWALGSAIEQIIALVGSLGLPPNSRVLMALHPELSADIAGYIDGQADECRVIADHLESAVWLLRREP